MKGRFVQIDGSGNTDVKSFLKTSHQQRKGKKVNVEKNPWPKKYKKNCVEFRYLCGSNMF